MDKKSKIIIGVLIAIIAILACLIAVYTLTPEEKPDNIVKVDKISFNTSCDSNVTKFKLYNKTSGDGGFMKYYVDENDSGYNLWIHNISKTDSATFNNRVKSFRTSFGNTPSETVDGIVIYTTSAVRGNHVGEPRYGTYIVNADLKTIVEFSTPSVNETVKIAHSLNFE